MEEFESGGDHLSPTVSAVSLTTGEGTAGGIHRLEVRRRDSKRVKQTEPHLRGEVEDPETMDAYIYEQDKQKRLYDELVAEGYTLADDPAGLERLIGQTMEIVAICEMWTPRLLCKLFVKGTEQVEHSFHLVPLHQIVKWLYKVPAPGDTFSGKFVIGVRRVGEGKYVPALRLPLK
jgi:hypothetical protein